MSPPYTIKEAASLCGLSSKYIYRLKDRLPNLFNTHTTRGKANKLLLSEELIQILKGVGLLKDRGESLHEIVRSVGGERQAIYELRSSGLSKLNDGLSKLNRENFRNLSSKREEISLDKPVQTAVQTVQTKGKLLSKLSKLARKSGEVDQGFEAYRSGKFSLDKDDTEPVQTVVQTVQTDVQTNESDSKLERQLRQEVLFLQNEVQFLKETIRRTEERFDRLLPPPREWGSPTPTASRKNVKGLLLESIITGAIAIAAGTALLFISQQILFAP